MREHVAVAAACAVASPTLLGNMKIASQTKPSLNFVQGPSQLLACVHVEHVRMARESILNHARFANVKQ
jgi:hypothetical protein